MASGVWKAWSGISGLSVCVYVLNGVSVITWPAAHETEKRAQAAYTMGHRQGDRRKVVCLYNVCIRERQHVTCVFRCVRALVFNDSIMTFSLALCMSLVNAILGLYTRKV